MTTTFNQQKAYIREMLTKRDFNALEQWATTLSSPLRRLMSLTYDSDELIAWRAIEGVGRVAALMAATNLEKVRDTIRRLLWLMSDESGGVGWHSPEIIGEILVNVPALIPEYGPLLPAYFQEEPFERGAFMAVFRAASVNAGPFREFAADLEQGLAEADPIIRAFSLGTLNIINDGQPIIKKMELDKTNIRFYNFNSGLFTEISIGAFVREYSDVSRKAKRLDYRRPVKENYKHDCD